MGVSRDREVHGPVGWREESGVAVLTLDEPATGNALGTATVHALRRHLERARDTAGVAAVLLRARGAEFCRGLDLEEAFGEDGLGQAGRDEARTRIEAYADLLELVRTVPLPVVCLVEGRVRAGGTGLVGAADVVLATGEATFQFTEVFLNLVPGVAAAHLAPGRIAPGVLRSLVLTGSVLDADEARAVGLVDEVLESGRAESRTRQLLRRLLRASPGAVAAAKGFWAQQLEPAVGRRGRAGADETAHRVADPGTASAVAALEAGRLPGWCLPFRPSRPLTAEGHRRREPDRGGSGEGRDPGPGCPVRPAAAGPVVCQHPADGVVEVRLADDAGRNALSPPLVRALLAALESVGEAGDGVRVCLLTGLPDVFCSGASREALAGVAEGRIDLDEAELAAAVLRCPVPVIAAAEGHAVGGGLVLLAAADLAILARDARYGAVFMDLGLTPGMGCTSLLPELVGPYLAREMMYAGGTRRGAELVGFGSRVHRVVPVGEVRPAALDLARRLAEKTPASLRLLKATLAGPRLAALARARSREDAMHQVLRADPSTPARALARFPR